MKNRNGMRYRVLLRMAALVLGLGIFGWGFVMTGMVSHAETQVKVTSPKGANIRKEASASSDRVGGAENGNVLPVLSQVQGSDGNTWYQVKSGDVTGYIRADLVEVSEGGTSAPAEGGETGSEGGGEQTPPPTVTAVNPVSATVSQESGKIRDSASSDGQILQEVPIETALTVTGIATDADGRDWYQVSFTSGESQVEGFIRYDYVTLAGELVPITGEPPAPEEPSEPEPEEEPKPYDTLMQDGAWLLVDYTLPEPKGYPILELFESVTGNQEAYQESEKTVKSQKIIIIVLVFALVAAAAGIAFLVFKIRDMMDSAYFNEVEKETLKKKTTAGKGARRAMPTVGEEKAPDRAQGASQRPRPTGAQGTRPAGATQSQRPAGVPQGQRSGNPQGQRPSGVPAGQRTPVQGQRPMSAAPGQRAGGNPQGQRPAGVQGTRPAGAPQGRPAGAVAGQRPAGATAGQRPAGSPQRGQGGQQTARPVRPAQAPPQKTQPKNFLADDEEYDNEFLNYDDE